MQTRPIRSPAELLEVLGIVKSGLAEGELREIPPPPRASDDAEVIAFAQLLEASHPRPDVFRVRLECPVCAQRFSLSCETYHGSGGRWSPDA
jgi:hypothetical protein